MLWVLYSLLSAFSFATADAFTKKAPPNVDDLILISARFLYGAPLALLFLFFAGIPQIGNAFWYAFAAVIPLEVIGWLLYVKSIRTSPISLVAPFLSFTPAFLVFTSFVLLGELPSASGFFGISLVVIGAYILHLRAHAGIFGPFKSILTQKGPLYMLLVAFIFSITASLSKIIVQNSSAMFAAAVYLSFLSISLIVILLLTARKKIIQLKTNFKGLLPIGFFYGSMAIFHNFAITLIIVPYMMSIKRSSSIFSVLYGHFLFKEENIRERLVRALIMLIGAGLIILS